jgi:hypothetical protein
MPNETSNQQELKAAWVEPQIKRLDVAETANLPNRGADGNRHADCTRS